MCDLIRRFGDSLSDVVHNLPGRLQDELFFGVIEVAAMSILLR
jgi:hypothetical protein